MIVLIIAGSGGHLDEDRLNATRLLLKDGGLSNAQGAAVFFAEEEIGADLREKIVRLWEGYASAAAIYAAELKDILIAAPLPAADA
jgi:hypothetical protein